MAFNDSLVITMLHEGLLYNNAGLWHSNFTHDRENCDISILSPVSLLTCLLLLLILASNLFKIQISIIDYKAGSKMIFPSTSVGFLLGFGIRTRRWRGQIHPKRRAMTEQHCIITQNTVMSLWEPQKQFVSVWSTSFIKTKLTSISLIGFEILTVVIMKRINLCLLPSSR